jgi:F0F1-type ATP synthase assembly protein I
MNNKEKQPPDQDWARYSGIGIQFVVIVVLFYWLGAFLDSKFDAKPIWTVVFTLFGLGAGFYHLIKQVLPPKK